VVYDDQDVDNPNITVLRIGNGGKQEIVADDFPEPISVDFGEAKIISFDTSARSNQKVTGTISFDSDNFGKFHFTPQLFNRDEWIELQLVTDGPVVTPKLHARFAGQPSPMDLPTTTASSSRAWKTRKALIGAAVVIAVVLLLSTLLRSSGLAMAASGAELIALTFAILGVLLAVPGARRSDEGRDGASHRRAAAR
jgi:hypothetical protein